MASSHILLVQEEKRRLKESVKKRVEALPVIDIHGYLGVSTLARAAAEAAAAEARG